MGLEKIVNIKQSPRQYRYYMVMSAMEKNSLRTRRAAKENALVDWKVGGTPWEEPQDGNWLCMVSLLSRTAEVYLGGRWWWWWWFPVSTMTQAMGGSVGLSLHPI